MPWSAPAGAPRALLVEGFTVQSSRVPLLPPQGIFKPALLDLPLSITTVPPSDRKPRPYDDEFDQSVIDQNRVAHADVIRELIVIYLDRFLLRLFRVAHGKFEHVPFL